MQVDSNDIRIAIKKRISFKQQDKAYPCVSLKLHIQGLEEALAIINRLCEDAK